MNSREASELYHSKTGFMQRQIMSCVHWNIVSSPLVDFEYSLSSRHIAKANMGPLLLYAIFRYYHGDALLVAVRK